MLSSSCDLVVRRNVYVCKQIIPAFQNNGK